MLSVSHWTQRYKKPKVWYTNKQNNNNYNLPTSHSEYLHWMYSYTKACFLTPEINNTYLPLIICTLCKLHVINATKSLNRCIIFLPYEFNLKLSSNLLTCNSWKREINRPIYVIINAVQFLIFKNLHFLHKFLLKKISISWMLQGFGPGGLFGRIYESTEPSWYNVQDLLNLRKTYKKPRVFPRALNNGPFVMD